MEGAKRRGLLISETDGRHRVQSRSQIVEVDTSLQDRTIIAVTSAMPTVTTLDTSGRVGEILSQYAHLFDRLPLKEGLYNLYYHSEYESQLLKTPLFIPELPLNYAVSHILAECHGVWRDRAFGEAILVQLN